MMLALSTNNHTKTTANGARHHPKPNILANISPCTKKKRLVGRQTTPLFLPTARPGDRNCEVSDVNCGLTTFVN